MSKAEREAFSDKVRQELATCQARLLADLAAVIAKQHEVLLKDLVGQFNGSNLRECATSGESAPTELAPREVSQVAPLASSPECVPQGREVVSVPVVAAEGPVSSIQNRHENPVHAESESMKLLDEDGYHGDDESDMSLGTGDEANPPRENAAFSSIFAASALEGTDLGETHYHVEDFYSKTGWAQWLARDERFANLTLAVIASNAVYIGIDADWNPAESLYDANPFFIFMDNAFALFFSIELLVRFLAFENKVDAVKDGWFKFDSFLVLIMVLETWVMAPLVAVVSSGGGVNIPVQPLRLLRLLRLTRMTRLMRSLPELVTMTKGMKVASRAVLSSLLMVALLIYTFAIVLNMGLKEEDEINDELAPRNFKTIPRTMWTLLMDGTFMDSTGDVLSKLLFSGSPVCLMCCVVFMAFILFSAITVMNMLIGVLCEVVSAVAQAEKDEADIALAKESILVNLKKFSTEDGKISKAKLMHVFRDKNAKVVLKSLNIDQLFLTELQQLLFPQPDSMVSIRAIMELMLMCRGDLPVTVQHIASSQATLFCTIEKMEDKLVHQLRELRHLQALSAHSLSAHSEPRIEKTPITSEHPCVCLLTEEVNVEPAPIGKTSCDEDSYCTPSENPRDAGF